MRTIAHISDLHFGRTDPAIVEALAGDVNARSPSLVAVSGDLTQRARPWQYEAAAAFLGRLAGPRIVVPGNHDIPLYDVVRRFFFPLQRYSDHITTDLWPMYRDEELFVMGLNTARPFRPRLKGFWKDGVIGADALESLRQQTESLPEGLFRVLVTHHPFIAPSAEYVGDIVQGVKAALPMLRQCKIDLLLAGHLHMGYCGDVGAHHEAVDYSILSVQAGTATSTRRREQKNTYNWITIEPDEVTIEVRAFESGAFSIFDTARFSRTEGVWNRH